MTMTVLSRRLFLGAGIAGCGCMAMTVAFAQTPAPQSPTGQYICPPCGCDEDGKVFDKPGTCPAAGCGMTLIPKPADPPKS
jgi:hypothetical protein